MPKNSEKQQKDQDVADKEEDLKVQLLSILEQVFMLITLVLNLAY